MLTGMTNKNAEALLPLSRSWENPPEVTADGASEVKYNQAERAFDVYPEKGAEVITLSFAANADSPLYNPAFVIHNAGNRDLKLELNGKLVPRGKEFRFGHKPNTGSFDIVSWINYVSEDQTEIKLHFK
jgi:hypothetical protein